ncbi:Telomerase Cajal body protein 1 [Holothuria leucospilota]|uniref:WD repeat-containing protein 79 n=1 Tax=Holothuria leucospilota TaxID=206669 RepID=A0A9Q1BQ74_HOLLE|nr:Telomerase Cajal body protein 1 [Holothuria leucospilota]
MEKSSVNKGDVTPEETGSQGEMVSKETGNQGDVITEEMGNQGEMVSKEMGCQGAVTPNETGSQGKVVSKDVESQGDVTLGETGSQGGVKLEAENTKSEITQMAAKLYELQSVCKVDIFKQFEQFLMTADKNRLADIKSHSSQQGEENIVVAGERKDDIEIVKENTDQTVKEIEHKEKSLDYSGKVGAHVSMEAESMAIRMRKEDQECRNNEQEEGERVLSRKRQSLPELGENVPDVKLKKCEKVDRGDEKEGGELDAGALQKERDLQDLETEHLEMEENTTFCQKTETRGALELQQDDSRHVGIDTTTSEVTVEGDRAETVPADSSHMVEAFPYAFSEKPVLLTTAKEDFSKGNNFLKGCKCFVSTCRSHPVHMWDAFDGQLRCSYRPHDHLDELITPHSLAFSLDGSKLYCGFNKLIKTFDITRPGKDCQTRQTKGKLGGQTGIISCFAMNPDGKMFAAGSYSKTIGLYSPSCPSAICVLHGQASGVTQLMYSSDGSKLFSGGRKILCWDVRKLNEVLFCMNRDVTTNQRMYFDIDSLHPSLPLLATASGQRMVQPPVIGSDGESDEEMDQDDEQKGAFSFHNSLRIWSLYDNR